MTKQEATKLVAAASAVPKGEDWGDALWTLTFSDDSTVDIHAADEDAARAAAVEWLIATTE